MESLNYHYKIYQRLGLVVDPKVEAIVRQKFEDGLRTEILPLVPML